MSQLFNNIKIFSSFWILLACYFIIPIFIGPVDPANWVYLMDFEIPFIWWMIIPYYIYYIIVLLPPLIWKDQWKIRNITSILNVMTIFCYLIFIIWPIHTGPIINYFRDAIESHPLKSLHYIIIYDEMLYQNALPSMHVVVSSFLCLAYYHDFKSYRLFAIGIGISIFLSTFLIKQHFILDSLSGILIAYVGFYYYKIKTKSCK